jgi:hypothetical protein
MMKRLLTLVTVVAVLMVAVATFWQGKSRAQSVDGLTAGKPKNVITMVCHESTTNGVNTDYVNAVDAAIYDTATGAYLTPAQVANLALFKDIFLETATNPTSCAQAASDFSAYGFKLLDAFSHFQGYYVLVFEP